MAALYETLVVRFHHTRVFTERAFSFTEGFGPRSPVIRRNTEG